MTYQRRKAWLSLRVPFKHGFEYTVDLGDEKMFDLRNLPPWEKLPVRPDSDTRGLLVRGHSHLAPEIV